MSFIVNWAQDSFPGVRDCFVEVYDKRGRIIGQYLSHLTVLTEGDRMELSVGVHGRAATAAVKCTGPRKDDVSGHYRITDEQVELVEGGSAIELSYFVEWRGMGKSGTQRCTTRFYKDGRKLFEETFTLTLRGPDRSISSVLPLRGRPAPDRAKVTCEPYS